LSGDDMSVKKKALITGITGMDGSHLAEFLLSENYDVFGMDRWKSVYNYQNIEHILDKISLVKGDLTDQNSIVRCINKVEPDEIYNLGAQSFVAESWNTPEATSNVTGLGCLRVLEAIKETNKSIKMYQASSSEMYGINKNISNESSPMTAASPYGVSKLFAHRMAKNYRESYGMFVCCGILFNHESERRGKHFVTRKITDGVARIKLGVTEKIYLGNINSVRDWGYAPDYVKGMWQMMQLENPDDFVLATGEIRSVKDFLDAAFKHIGCDNWSKYVAIDQKYIRPLDLDYLYGDFSKAQNTFNWSPETKFNDWVGRMINNDIDLVKREQKNG
jgi:GDPmannose 4,6-dehydratase